MKERSKLYSIDEFAYDEDGNCLLDYIIKLEDLDYQLPKILDIIGVPSRHIVKVNMAKKRRNHYSNYYNSETIQIVADIHKEDIRISNYTFRAPSNKFVEIVKRILKI